MRTYITQNSKNRASLSFSVTDNYETATPIASFDVDKFNEAYNKQLMVSHSVLMPAALRYVSPDRNVLVWERPPHHVTFQYTLDQQSDIGTNDKSRFIKRLPIPWQYYIVLLSNEHKVVNTYMFFGRDQLRSMTSGRLYTPPILNFFSTSRLCPAAYINAPEYGSDWDEILNYVYSMIWHSGFNIDTVQAISTLSMCANPLNSYISDFNRFYQKWSKLSLKDVVEMQYHVAHKSLSAFLDSGLIFYDYKGSSVDIALNITFAAQDAESMK